MASFIQMALDHFPLTLLLLGLLAALVSLLSTRRQRNTERVAATLLRWFLVFSVGVSFLTSFVMHSFFGATVAHAIGWAPSPFQFEVGTASLGYALVAFLAAFGSLSLRLAALVGPAAFLWGGAAGRLMQVQHVQAQIPGYLDSMPAANLFIPLIGFILLAWQAKAQSRRSVFARSRL